MKYFTKDWCFGKLDDKEYENVERNYQKYIENIYEDLPATLKILIKNINLHDGIIKKVTFLKKENLFELEGIFGDLNFGYFGLTLKYYEIKLLSQDLLKSIFENKNLEILSNEIEKLNRQKYSHQIIFDNGHEFEIEFKNLELRLINESSESYQRVNCKLLIDEK